mmetsp:Transcript_12158/g.26249  ORF Transcript_12158/g.26249 Transcript_12158/m.26249 type:complete len:282 (+) Transcript_12158:168-1013(+)
MQDNLAATFPRCRHRRDQIPRRRFAGRRLHRCHPHLPGPHHQTVAACDGGCLHLVHPSWHSAAPWHKRELLPLPSQTSPDRSGCTGDCGCRTRSLHTTACLAHRHCDSHRGSRFSYQALAPATGLRHSPLQGLPPPTSQRDAFAIFFPPPPPLRHPTRERARTRGPLPPLSHTCPHGAACPGLWRLGHTTDCGDRQCRCTSRHGSRYASPAREPATRRWHPLLRAPPLPTWSTCYASIAASIFPFLLQLGQGIPTQEPARRLAPPPLLSQTIPKNIDHSCL